MRLLVEKFRMREHIPNSKAKIHQILCFSGRTVLEWREHEDEDVDRVVQGDIFSQKSLRACGLYKFWCLGSLRVQPRLLQMLVGY